MRMVIYGQNLVWLKLVGKLITLMFIKASKNPSFGMLVKYSHDDTIPDLLNYFVRAGTYTAYTSWMNNIVNATDAFFESCERHGYNKHEVMLKMKMYVWPYDIDKIGLSSTIKNNLNMNLKLLTADYEKK